MRYELAYNITVKINNLAKANTKMGTAFCLSNFELAYQIGK